MADEKLLGCHYFAPTFNAHYPDGECIDGFMWDMDSCDEPGGGLTSGGDVPCPWCNTAAYVDYLEIPMSGNSRQRRAVRRIEVRRLRVWAERRSSFAPATGSKA